MSDNVLKMPSAEDTQIKVLIPGSKTPVIFELHDLEVVSHESAVKARAANQANNWMEFFRLGIKDQYDILLTPSQAAWLYNRYADKQEELKKNYSPSQEQSDTSEPQKTSASKKSRSSARASTGSKRKKN